MSKSAKSKSVSFDQYVATQGAEFRPYLVKLRKLIKSIVPDAEETFSYQAHCFKHIYMLVGIGANKNSCSLYTMSPGLVKKMKSDLSEYQVSGATLHFNPTEPLPTALITKIVLARKNENEMLALIRKKSK